MVSETTEQTAVTSAEATGTVTRGKFYAEDTHFVVFQAQNVLHRVPRYALVKHSEMFRDMFQLPQPGEVDDGKGSDGEVSSSGEGSSDENPIKIPDCFTNFEFESLLQFIYPTGKSKALNQEQLLAALKLALHWQMHDVISNIEDYIASLDLTPAEKLKLGKEHKIQKLLEEGFLSFVTPVEYNPTQEDAEELGWDTIGQILFMREALRTEITAMEISLSELRCEGCVSAPEPEHGYWGGGSAYGGSLCCELCGDELVKTAWVKVNDTLVESVSSSYKKKLIDMEVERILKRLLGTKYGS